MEEFSDDQLVRQAKAGDAEAFAQLILRYQERIYKMILRMTRNPVDAGDLAQDAFLQAYRSLRRFRQRSGFYTWIYRIAVNLTLNFLKKADREVHRRDVELDSLSSHHAGAGEVPSPERQALEEELRKRLEDALDTLPPSYRAAFILVEMQGMSHRQAARILSCSENTVSWRMHKARKMLQERLRPYLEKGTL